jgi:hypothetical protein
MRLTSTGLGIGTSSPGVKLDVSGADGVRSRVIATSGGTSGLILSSSGNTAYTIKAGNADNSLRIDQDGTDRLTLASGGNLGLGVTPSAWSGSYTAMQIRSLSLFGSTSNSEASIGGNVFVNTSGQYAYRSSTVASLYQQVNGTHAWLTAPSGTAGSPISFTQAMTLDASGNLAVGTTSPQGKLHIASTTSSVTWGSPGNPNQLTASVVIGDISATGGSLAVRTNSNSTYTSGLGVDGTYDSPSGISTINLKAFGIQAVGYGSVLAFHTSSGTTLTERARITSGGNLLVNNTYGTSSKLIVAGAGTSNAAFSGIFCDGNGANILALRNDGYIDTGTRAASPYNLTTASAANMYVDSTGGLYRSTSSLKYKTEVQNATHGLAEVMQLRPVTYKGKTDGDTVFGGLIAEEVHAAGLTEFVQYAEDGSPDALAYGNMVSLCIKAIQELKAELDTVKAELATLKGN